MATTICISTEPLYNGFIKKDSSDNFMIQFDVAEKYYTHGTIIPTHYYYNYRDSHCCWLSCTTLMSDHNYNSIESQNSVCRMVHSITTPFSLEETLYWKPSKYSKHSIIPMPWTSCDDDEAIINHTIKGVDGVVNRILSLAHSMAKQGNKRMLVTIEKLVLLPPESHVQVIQIMRPRPANMIENFTKSVVRFENNGVEVPLRCWQRIFNDVLEINRLNLWDRIYDIISESHIIDRRRHILLNQLRSLQSVLQADEVAEFGPMPAPTSAIEGLKKIIIVDEENLEGTCSICLEEMTYVNGYNIHVMAMPCLHLFHTKCIYQWLKSSHTCPLCRCKLPTGD